MSPITNIWAVAALLASSASAHMIMREPVPFSVDKIDSGPITAAQFPCKSQLGFTVSTLNQMAVGEKKQISFKGSAVHGGGSCQLSITTDKEPNANSKFKVIKSIEGGCPGVGAGGGNGQEGSDAGNVYDFELPDSIPSGQVTFAWTWMPKLSGAPEFYMNCAPVMVSGGASDTSKFDELPDLFVSNINECKTPVGGAVKFPSPGAVLQDGGTGDVKAPTGQCAAGSGGNGNSPAPAPSKAPTTTAAKAPTAAPSNPGGVFAPVPSPSGGAATSTATTLVTVTGTGPAVVAPTSPAAPAPPSNGTPSTGGNSCSENGAIVCNGANQFGLCNNGQVVWQQVAEGTTCSDGKIQKRHSLAHLKARSFLKPHHH
jgi:hypothetical protein